jgi:alpha-glucosidase
VTDSARRTIAIDLGFLPAGRSYRAEIWRDGEGGGIDGDRFAMVRETRTVRAGDRLSLTMEAGGGFALSLRPVEAR